MAGWHHRLDGQEFGWTPGDVDGQGGLACCSSWVCKESNMTEWRNWTKLNGINLTLIIISLSEAQKVPSTVQSSCSGNTNWLIHSLCIYYLFLLLHLHLFNFRKMKFPAIFTVSQLSPTVSTNCHLLGKSPTIGRVSRLNKEKYKAKWPLGPPFSVLRTAWLLSFSVHMVDHLMDESKIIHPWQIHVDVWQNQYNIVK